MILTLLKIYLPLLSFIAFFFYCFFRHFVSLPQFGDSQQLRLVRILRSTVMVRVGGGWMALDEFLVKNDPCRGKAYLHKHTLVHTHLHKHQEQLCIRKLMYLVRYDMFQMDLNP